MKIFVISLKRTPARLKKFAQSNPHINYTVFDAVDGAQLSAEEISAPKKVGVGYTAGALGCYWSHVTLWKGVVANGEPVTICEDDALLHERFMQRSAELIASKQENWDVILWGWNMDSVLDCDLMPGISSAAMTFRTSEFAANLSRFHELDFEPKLFALRKAFGTLCYSISARGAAKFLKQVVPLMPMDVWFPILNKRIRNTGVDIMMNDMYQKSDSFVCVPPLAVSPNHVAESTVQVVPPATSKLECKPLFSQDQSNSSSEPSIHDVVAHCESLEKELYFVPWIGNLGDALITAGIYAAFAQAGVRLSLWDKKTAHSGMALVVGAGGSLVPLYRESADALMALQTLPVGNVIVLPATIQGHEAVFRHLDERFHIFCRDLTSYAYVSRVRGSAKVFLDHDMALRLDPWRVWGEAELMEKSGGLGPDGLRVTERILRLAASHALRTKGRGRLFRGDAEAGGFIHDSSAFDLSVLCVRNWEDEATTVLIVAAFLRAISMFDEIETDRLHVAIAAGLLGIPVKLYPNSYFKNRAVFEHSIRRQYPSVQFVEAPVAQPGYPANAIHLPSAESMGHAQSIDIAGKPLWVKSRQVSLRLTPEALGSAFLIPAAKAGKQLVGPQADPVWQAGTQSILNKVAEWWGYRAPPVNFQRAVLGTGVSGRKTGLAFSLGVDSFYTLFFADPAPDFLFYVAGYDVPLHDKATLAAYQDSLKAIATALGREWAVVETNLRQHPGVALAPWGNTHGGAIAFVGHTLHQQIDTLLISSSSHREALGPWGSHPDLDVHWSSTSLKVVHFGDYVRRSEKLKQLVNHPVARQFVADHVRVCWERPDVHGNCGYCHKCTMLRVNLLRDAPALNVRTMPIDIPLDEAIDALAPLANQLSINLRYELLDVPDLEVRAALQRFIDRSEAAIQVGR